MISGLQFSPFGFLALIIKWRPFGNQNLILKLSIFDLKFTVSAKNQDYKEPHSALLNCAKWQKYHLGLHETKGKEKNDSIWLNLFQWPIITECIYWVDSISVLKQYVTQRPGGGGGTDLKRGYGDVRPWRPPFQASPAARKGPISSRRVSSQDPLLRNFGNFSLNSLNFHQNFSSQAPKIGNFQLTSPQIWKFSTHKPPFSEANVSSQAPHFGNLGRTPLPEKKLSAPPRPNAS